MTPEALYAAFAQLIAETPELGRRDSYVVLTPEHHKWFGRLIALLESMGDTADAFAVKQAILGLGSSSQDRSSAVIMTRLHTGFARAELEVPMAARGSFIPAGDTFGGLAAVAELLRGAKRTVFIVDPYPDDTLLSKFAVLMQESVELKVLGDRLGTRPGLFPALELWRQQYPKRPVSVRLAPPRALHDRAIFIDELTAYTIGQSLKDLAARAHCLIQMVDTDLAKEKMYAYSIMYAEGLELSA